MRLLRPYIPLDVRIQVAERMNTFTFGTEFIGNPHRWRKRAWLSWLLQDIFGEKEVQLDHDPALENRVKVFDDNGRLTGYIPAANDPEYLIYREKHAHHIKTNVRGDGAQYSDRALAKRERKRNRAKKKYNWPSRPFQKRLSPSARLAKLNELQRKR